MIFISYSWHDAGHVQPFVNKLQEYGMQVWIDLLYLDLKSDLRCQIQLAVSKCDTFLLFQSESAATSPWVQFERTVASAHQKRCLSVPVTKVNISDDESYKAIYSAVASLCAPQASGTVMPEILLDVI